MKDACPFAFAFQGDVVHRQLLFHKLLAVRGTQRRFHDRHRVVGHQGQTETKQRRLGITQRVDLATQVFRQMLEGGLHRPAVGIQAGDLQAIRHLHRKVREDVELPVALLGRLVQGDRDAPHRQRLAVLLIRQQDCLFIDRSAPLVLPDQTTLPLQFPHQVRLMLAEDEKCGSPGNSEHDPGRAKIPIGDHALATQHGLDNLLGQRTLLGVPVFAGNHVANQIPLGIVEHQRLSRQSRRSVPTQPQEPMICARQVIAIQDPQAKSRQQRRRTNAHGFERRAKFGLAMTDQGRRDRQFQMFQLVVHGLPGHGKCVGVGLVPSAHGRANLKHDVRHDFAALSEGKFQRVLSHRMVLKDLLQFVRVQNSLQRPTNHHTHRAGLDKLLEPFAKQHPCRSCFKGLPVTPSVT